MIDLYTWSTSNGRKASIMLEELGADYAVHPIHIGKGDQFTPEYLAINPNGKIPAIVDSDGSERRADHGLRIRRDPDLSGGEIRPVPAGGARRADGGHSMADVPDGRHRPRSSGQVHHFLRAAKEKVPYGIERYGTEARRLYGVLDRRLDGRDHLAGDGYSIADIATWPWVLRHEWQQVDLAEYPNVKRWFDAVGSRPAVQSGIQIPPPPQ